MMHATRTLVRNKTLLLFTLFIAVFLTLSLAGCGGSKSAGSSSSESTSNQAAPAAPENEPESKESAQATSEAASSANATSQAPAIDERYVGTWAGVSILGRNEDGSIKEGPLSDIGIEYIQLSIDEHGIASESARSQNGDDLSAAYLLTYDEQLPGYRAHDSSGKHWADLIIVPREGDAPDEMLYKMILDEGSIGFRMVRQ